MTRKKKSSTESIIRKAIKEAKKDSLLLNASEERLDELIDFVFPNGLDRIQPTFMNGPSINKLPE